MNPFERLASSGVDYIEIGFLDQTRPFDIDRTITPDTNGMNAIYEGLKTGNSTIVGMIDYGTCNIENIAPCKDTIMDGIRVIFKKQKIQEAIAFCKQIKELGYKVFVQAVSITSYSDEEALIVDNPMIMLIRLLDNIGVAKIALAGFDGYEKTELPNYVNANMEHTFSKEKAREINEDVVRSLERLQPGVPIEYVTSSLYQEIETCMK